jgi:hypothetical protein
MLENYCRFCSGAIFASVFTGKIIVSFLVQLAKGLYTARIDTWFGYHLNGHFIFMDQEIEDRYGGKSCNFEVGVWHILACKIWRCCRHGGWGRWRLPRC